MALKVNTTEIEEIILNGLVIDCVIANGVVVYESSKDVVLNKLDFSNSSALQYILIESEV